jgi:hypothetical protein
MRVRSRLQWQEVACAVKHQWWGKSPSHDRAMSGRGLRPGWCSPAMHCVSWRKPVCVWLGERSLLLLLGAPLFRGTRLRLCVLRVCAGARGWVWLQERVSETSLQALRHLSFVPADSTGGWEGGPCKPIGLRLLGLQGGGAVVLCGRWRTLEQQTANQSTGPGSGVGVPGVECIRATVAVSPAAVLCLGCCAYTHAVQLQRLGSGLSPEQHAGASSVHSNSEANGLHGTPSASSANRSLL